MSVHELREIQQAWSGVADILFVPHNQTEYQQLVTTLDRLIDTVGEQESPPLASLMEL